MNQEKIKMERRYEMIFPDYRKAFLVLIGCGGTGSYLAQNIARLSYVLRQAGKEIRALFIDPEKVEAGNVGRQNFCPAEIGRSKAEALSTRYNLSYGLKSEWMEKSFDDGCLNRMNTDGPIILIGAVDSAKSRAVIDRVCRREYRTYWLDCGNLYTNGQILIGNSETGRMNLEESLTSLGLCGDLPYPSIQHPEIIDPQKDAVRAPASCAQLIMRGEQGLFVNQTVAAYGASMLYQILAERSLKQFSIYFDLANGTNRSLAITEENLKKYFKARRKKSKRVRGMELAGSS